MSSQKRYKFNVNLNLNSNGDPMDIDSNEVLGQLGTLFLKKLPNAINNLGFHSQHQYVP